MVMDDSESVLQELVPASEVRCQGCDMPIMDQFLLRVGQGQWHEDCVKCAECHDHLFDRCYEREHKLFCKLHYYKFFSPNKCSGCKEGVAPSDMVYKLKNGILYHISCHRCAHCRKALSPGEQIVVDNASSSVACLAHYQHIFSPDNSRRDSSADGVDSSIQQTPVPPTFPVHDSASSSSSSFSFPSSLDPYNSYYSGDDNLPLSQKYLKRRGPRTTIKQSQLDVLNRVFNATPKPSKHARAKLALETGLSMRVIQVWFQNRRSKERRLKHLCNWIRENESRGLIPPISPGAPLPHLSSPHPDDLHHLQQDGSISDGGDSTEHQY